MLIGLSSYDFLQEIKDHQSCIKILWLAVSGGGQCAGEHEQNGLSESQSHMILKTKRGFGGLGNFRISTKINAMALNIPNATPDITALKSAIRSEDVNQI